MIRDYVWMQCFACHHWFKVDENSYVTNCSECGALNKCPQGRI